MRIIVDVLLLLPALLYQTTLSAHFSMRGVGLDLMAVLLASLSIVQGWAYGAVGGLLCGIVMDCVFGVTGYWSLQYMLIGLLVGLLGDGARQGRWLVPALTVFVACALRELPVMVYLYFVSAQVGWGYAFLKVLAGSAVCTVVFLPVHWLIRRLHQWDVISAPRFHFHGRKW